MLIALLSLTPPIVALPVHALVQIGSNAGRAWMLRPHVMNSVVIWFIPGSILGVLLASQLIVTLPTSTLQLMLALFILWTVWAPKINTLLVPDKAYLLVGGLTSFATMFLGATGPLLAVFLVASTLWSRSHSVNTCSLHDHSAFTQGHRVWVAGFCSHSVAGAGGSHDCQWLAGYLGGTRSVAAIARTDFPTDLQSGIDCACCAAAVQGNHDMICNNIAMEPSSGQAGLCYRVESTANRKHLCGIHQVVKFDKAVSRSGESWHRP